MPSLAELAVEFGDRVGFLSLLTDFDTGREAAIDITEWAGAPFITIDVFNSDLNYLLRLLDSGFIPTTVLIGAGGEVIGGQLVGASAEDMRILITDALG